MLTILLLIVLLLTGGGLSFRRRDAAASSSAALGVIRPWARRLALAHEVAEPSTPSFRRKP
jgi:hypothetical protein